MDLSDLPFGQRLQKIRNDIAGFSQSELAKASGVAVDTIRSLEQGLSAKPQQSTLRKLADAMGVTIPLLRDGDDATGTVDAEALSADQIRRIVREELAYLAREVQGMNDAQRQMAAELLKIGAGVQRVVGTLTQS